jgi:Ca2+-binding EF-hand superfamily protein
MKKLILNSLVGIFASSFVTACGNQSDLILDNNLNQVNQNITVQSRGGLNDAYKHLLNYQFNLLDVDKDKFVSIDEFAPSYELPNSASNMVPVYNNNKKTSLISRLINFFKKKPNQKILNDIYARFAAVDRNKDLKISLQEAQKQPIYFLGRSKDNLRDMAEFSFAMIDANKDKKISIEEFSKYSNTNSSLLVTFYSADKNKDNVLKFSEYEDMLYSVLKFYANNPVQQPVTSEPTTPVQEVPNQPIASEPTVPNVVDNDSYVQEQPSVPAEVSQ